MMQSVDAAIEREMGSVTRPAYIFVSAIFFLFRLSTPAGIILLIYPSAPEHAFKNNPYASHAETLITEWDLTGTRAWIPSLLQSLFYIGAMAGSVVCGQLSDYYGRKSVVWKVYAIHLLVIIAMGFAQTWQQFAACRVIHGFLRAGLGIVENILLQEMTAHKLWVVNGAFGSLTFTSNMLFYMAFAYYFPSWRTLHFIMAIPGLLGFIFFFIIPESPRWLYTKGRIDEAEATIHRFARWNRAQIGYQQLNNDEENGENQEEIEMDNLDALEEYVGNVQEADNQPLNSAEVEMATPDEIQKHETDVVNADCQQFDNNEEDGEGQGDMEMDNLFEEHAENEEEPGSRSILDLLKQPLRNHTLVMSFQWFTMSFVYACITLGSSAFSDNFYLANIISAISQLPPVPLVMFLLERKWAGRRRTLAGCTFLTSVAMLIMFILSTATEQSSYTLVLLLLGKLGVSGAFDLIYVYTPELYPTVVRNVGLGAMSTCARAAGIIAPFIANAVVHSNPDPSFLSYAILCGLCAALAVYLPETRGSEIANLIHT